MDFDKIVEKYRKDIYISESKHGTEATYDRDTVLKMLKKVYNQTINLCIENVEIEEEIVSIYNSGFDEDGNYFARYEDNKISKINRQSLENLKI